VKTKTHFAFRVDIWDDTGDSIGDHVAGVGDFEVAEATYRAAVARWPAARITLRQGIRWCMIAGNAPAEVGDQCEESESKVFCLSSFGRGARGSREPAPRATRCD
jgi:hypothetical protein